MVGRILSDKEIINATQSNIQQARQMKNTKMVSDRTTIHQPHAERELSAPERDRSEIDAAMLELETNISNLTEMFTVLTSYLGPVTKPLGENSQMINGAYGETTSPMSIMRQRINCSSFNVLHLRDRIEQLINHIEI